MGIFASNGEYNEYSGLLAMTVVSVPFNIVMCTYDMAVNLQMACDSTSKACLSNNSYSVHK